MKKIIGALIAALILLIAIPAAAASTTVTVNKKTAEPGDTVTITGTATDENVVIKITDEAGNIVFFDAVAADASGKYSAAFKVPPDMTPGKLTVTAGSGTDVATTVITVTSPPTATPKPTAKPTSTSKPTPTATPKPTPTATPKPTATPTATPIATTTPAPTPAQTEEAPGTGDESPEATPTPQAGKVVITIVVSDLPDGTTAVKLPNGEVIELDGSDTIQIEVDEVDVGEDGSMEVIALDDEGTPLGTYTVQAERITVPNAGGAWDAIWPVLMWVLIGIVGLGVIALAAYVILRKRQDA